MVAKRDCHMWTCPFRPAGKSKPRRAVGVCHISAFTDTSHRAGLGLGAAPIAPSTADTVVMQLGEYWDCGRQRSKKGLLVAARSFPKTSWLWELTKDAQEIDCYPCCSQESLTQSPLNTLSLELTLVKYLLG